MAQNLNEIPKGSISWDEQSKELQLSMAQPAANLEGSTWHQALGTVGKHVSGFFLASGKVIFTPGSDIEMAKQIFNNGNTGK